jgi:four helix bundle protein
MYMSQQPITRNKKPYEIRERTFLFACDVTRAMLKLHTRGRIAGAFSLQLVAAAVSAASNLQESDDASSDKDFRAKERIVLRELKEAKLRLRVLLAVNLLSNNDEELVQEASELVKIVATIIRNNSLKRRAAITTGLLGIWVLGFGIWVLITP